MPPIHLVGNAHLDPAWMWRMDEGLAAFRATCRSALDRIDEFPGFIFTCSSAAHYAFVEETDPALFVRIQEAVRNERWSIVGGWWVEPDCNLPSGESFIRQALIGPRYFLSHFGKIATVGYNIDSFGHNANLPQLLRKAGICSYVFMRPGQEEKSLPSPLFSWEAPSGDRVTAYRLPFHYSNFALSTRQKLAELDGSTTPRPHLRTAVEHPWMIFFGVGNHGGGPTIAELTDIARLREERNDVILSDPERFFASVDIDALPVVRGEMQPHAIGCYSAHSEIKQLHRRAEAALLLAERAQVLAVIAGLTPGDLPHEAGALNLAWKNLCFNQFHDILGGVAIPEACNDAISMFRESISIGERITRTELLRLAARIDTRGYIQNLIVFNASAHERQELVEFELWQPEEQGQEKLLPCVRLISPDGAAIQTQRIESSGKIGNDRARFAAIVRVPSFGWSVFVIERIEGSDTTDATDVKLTFDHVPAVIVRDDSDTWGHGATSFTDYIEEFQVDATEIFERGPLRTGIRIKSSGGASRLEEEILVTKDNPAIEVRVFLDWHERHRILKLRFRHGCIDPVARYEIPYASIERPVGQSEWPGQTWVDVTERDGSRGLAIATESKYSYSVDQEYIYVIAARSPLFANHVPPHVVHEGERIRYQDQGEQEFRLLLIPHEGSWSGRHLHQLRMPLIPEVESEHEGTLPKNFSGFERKSTAIHIGAIKLAESGEGIILRAAEQARRQSDADFGFPTIGARWRGSFAPFEIKTLLIQDGKVSEVDFLERPV